MPADSIALQDQENPSAKDHNAKQSGSAQLLGTHQAETLREVAAETKEERRLSWANGDIGDLQQYADELSRADAHGDHGDSMQGRDALAVTQNGGGGAADDGDMDTDTDLDDDDMMDKISSSPSIEDGGCSPELPPLWPARVDSLRTQPSHASSESPGSPVFSEAGSSSSYLETPEHLPFGARDSSKAWTDPTNGYHHPLEYTRMNQGDTTTDGNAYLTPDSAPHYDESL